MEFKQATIDDFDEIQKFYWDVIDEVHRINYDNENLGWEKGVYPSDEFIKNSLIKGELYTLSEDGVLFSCFVLNSRATEGYADCHWDIFCLDEEVLIPHALAVHPSVQGKGVGRKVVEYIINKAKTENKKAVRLDIVAACKAAERLYLSCGFKIVDIKELFYEDTGLTTFKMMEKVL